MTTPGPIKGTRSKRGVLTKVQRAALTETLAHDILRVYKGLGGAKWLLEWAKANPSEFMKQGLARLLPPMPKDDPDILIQQQFNNGIDGNSTEVARRIAFALSLGLQGQQDPVVDRQPYVHLAQEPTPQELLHAGLEPDPEREAWAEQVALTPEERLNAESLDAHTNRRAFAESPTPSVVQRVRTPVRLHNPRNSDDLI